MKPTDIVDLKKGTWSPDEDQQLITCIKRYGIRNWSLMPLAAGLSRSGKSCRLRWMNYLRPDLKRERFRMEEIETIIKVHESLGNKWSKIAAKLPGRTDNEIKNFWHTHAKKYIKSNSTVPRANHRRPKTCKHKEKRVTELKSSLSYGAKESNLENSSTSEESTQFYVVESYSPSKDSDAAFAGNDILENVRSSETHREIQENFFTGPFCTEDLYLPVINSTIFEEASSEYQAHEWKVEEYAHASNNEDLISFWFNIFLEANHL